MGGLNERIKNEKRMKNLPNLKLSKETERRPAKFAQLALLFSSRAVFVFLLSNSKASSTFEFPSKSVFRGISLLFSRRKWCSFDGTGRELRVSVTGGVCARF